MSKILQGWLDVPELVEQDLRSRDNELYKIKAGDERALGVRPFQSSDKKPIVLLDSVVKQFPAWRRGAQGIGDCVSWGYELACTVVVCVRIHKLGEPIELVAEFATEDKYGGSRVEARGKRRADWQDGSYGSAAAKWVTDWGALLRIDYSEITGNPEHDLSKYDAKKAKNWGYWGNGGEKDKGKLDNVSRMHPVSKAFQVKNFDQYAAAIESGYPVSICSSQGLGKRNGDGFAPPKGTWYHCMLGGGLRYDKPGGLITNSWGNSWGDSAPLPGVVSSEIKKCSAWVDARTLNRMLAAGDSFALTGVEGLQKRDIDWTEGWEVHGRD